MKERLLPRTEAIPRRTAEMIHYRGGFLVRYKSASGSVRQRVCTSREEAAETFWQYVSEMEKESYGEDVGKPVDAASGDA